MNRSEVAFVVPESFVEALGLEDDMMIFSRHHNHPSHVDPVFLRSPGQGEVYIASHVSSLGEGDSPPEMEKDGRSSHAACANFSQLC